MLKKSSIIIMPLILVVLFFASTVKAQENPYAIETKVIKNEQAIQNLRQQQANLYLKMEDLLVKYGELMGKIQDMNHRLDAIEARLNSLASNSGAMQNMNSTKTLNPYATPGKNQSLNSTIPSTTEKQSVAQQTTQMPQQAQNAPSATTTQNVNKIAANINKTIKQPPKKPVAENDKIAYLAAKKLYDAKRYRAAIEAFSNFKRQYKKSKYLPNAIFYLAQSHFNIGEYDKAIISYDYLINTYPKNKYVPMALLREGISFIKLGDNIDGKYLLKKTISSYPNTKEAVAAKKYLSKLK